MVLLLRQVAAAEQGLETWVVAVVVAAVAAGTGEAHLGVMRAREVRNILNCILKHCWRCCLAYAGRGQLIWQKAELGSAVAAGRSSRHDWRTSQWWW
jgi:hypothetical protein